MPSVTGTRQPWRLPTPSMVTRQSKHTPIMQEGKRSAPLTAVERRASQLEASSAAETVSPCRAATATPSTKICTGGRLSCSDRLNILAPSISLVAAVVRGAGGAKTAGRERADQLRLERALLDHPRDLESVVGGERHAGMAAGDEGAGMRLRLVVDRKAVLRHDADAGPAPDHVEPREMRKHALGAIGHHGADRMLHRTIVELVFLAVTDHHRAFVGLADRGQRMRQERHGALGHHDLATGRAHRGVETDHRRQRLVGIAGGEHDLGGTELALRRRQAEFTAALADRRDRTLRKIIDAEGPEAGVERTKRAQRIDVTVEWTKAAARNFRPN